MFFSTALVNLVPIFIPTILVLFAVAILAVFLRPEREIIN